jgi:hypothetical protein
MSHTIRVTETLAAADVELAVFTADVTVNWHRASGNNWDEPREPAFGELAKVTQVDGPYIPPLKLALWADLWVEANQRTIENEILSAQPF